jgi:hypothetical protein
MEQPGLNDRHRDKDGTIAKKHGNTPISTLRRTYGVTFPAGCSGSAKLSDCLETIDESRSRSWCAAKNRSAKSVFGSTTTAVPTAGRSPRRVCAAASTMRLPPTSAMLPSSGLCGALEHSCGPCRS